MAVLLLAVVLRDPFKMAVVAHFDMLLLSLLIRAASSVHRTCTLGRPFAVPVLQPSTQNVDFI